MKNSNYCPRLMIFFLYLFFFIIIIFLNLTRVDEKDLTAVLLGFAETEFPAIGQPCKC